MLRWPVEPMRAASGGAVLPEAQTSTGRVYEPKFDGWRLLAWITDDGVELQSRHGRPLTQYLPDVCRALAETLPPGVVLDGELVSLDVDRGKTSFTALQRRITAGRGLAREVAARPCHLVVFDMLRDEHGIELLGQPLSARRRRLESLLSSAPPQLPLCPQTDDEQVARSWLTEWTRTTGVEGVVVKTLSGRYRPGKTGSWVKVKARSTTELVIGGVTGTIAYPRSLLLGRLDSRGILRHLSQTHPIRAAQRRELAGLLQPMAFQGDGSGHPWPLPLPAAWSVDLTAREPVHYIQVEPTVIAEVMVDVAVDGPVGRHRHRSTMVRARPDLTVDDIDRLPAAHAR